MISSFSFLLEYRNLCVLSNYIFLSITFLWMNCLCISSSNLKWWHIYLKKYRYYERMSVMWYSTFLFHIFMIYYLHILLLDLFSHTWHFTSWFGELVNSASLAAYVIWTMNGICAFEASITWPPLIRWLIMLSDLLNESSAHMVTHIYTCICLVLCFFSL